MTDSIHSVPTLVNQFVATVDTDDAVALTYAQEIATLLTTKELSLLQFIQYLGPTLTSDNDTLRTKAVKCLMFVLKDLSSKPVLSKQDINVLTDFLLNKFDDSACLQSILASLATLIKFNNFLPQNNVDKILSKLLETYNPKKNLAKVRHEAFQVLNSIILAQLAHLVTNQATSNQYIKTFLHLATGEKDPRNLLISFKLNKEINQQFIFEDNELHNEFINELFDNCFCYFPISFTPPPNDPYKITAVDLKDSLRATIASQSAFAKDSFVSLIEKLTSTNPQIRNDVLKTLLLCVESYSSSTIEEYWLTLWNALKFEILHNDISIFLPNAEFLIPQNFQLIDDNDDTKALILTLVIIQKIAEKLDDTQLDNSLSTVVGELKDNLVTIKEKSKQAVLLLAVLVSDSIHSFNYIVDFLFSYDVWGKFISVERATFNQDKNDDLDLNVSKQRDLVDSFGYIFIGYQSLVSKLGGNEAYVGQFLAINELTHYKDHLLIFLGQLLMTSSNMEKTLKCKVIQQLVKLISIEQFLNSNDVELILGYFNDILNSLIENNDKWENDVVVKEIITGLIRLTNDHQQTIIELILPNLLNYLDSQATNLDQFEKITNLIGELCVDNQMLEVLSIRLLNKLSYVSKSDISLGEKVKVYQSIVELFIRLINKVQLSHQFLMNSWYKSFVPQFLVSLTALEIQDEILIELSSDLIGLIVKFIDVSKHKQILEDFRRSFYEGTTSDLNISIDVFKAPTVYITILNKVIANVDKSVELVGASELNNQVIAIIKTIDSEFLRIAYLQNLALINNKFNKNETVVIDILSAIFDQVESRESLETDDLISFEILIWLVKSLIINMDKIGVEYLNKLIDVLTTSSNLELKSLIAESLRILFTDLKVFVNQTPTITAKKIISKVNNLNIKLLYKQQIFEIVLPKLIESYNQDVHSEIFLSALSLIIENLSKNVLVPHLPEILPLVLNGLTIKNTLILKSSLSTLSIIIEENQEILQNDLSMLIPLLTKLATTTKSKVNTEEIRVLSLGSLIAIFSKFNNLERYRDATLADSKIGLDDKRRSVRKLCCDLRQSLYELK